MYTDTIDISQETRIYNIPEAKTSNVVPMATLNEYFPPSVPTVSTKFTQDTSSTQVVIFSGAAMRNAFPVRVMGIAAVVGVLRGWYM